MADGGGSAGANEAFKNPENTLVPEADPLGSALCGLFWILEVVCLGMGGVGGVRPETSTIALRVCACACRVGGGMTAQTRGHNFSLHF